MDYLQYISVPLGTSNGFTVLNLIINGLPSIQLLQGKQYAESKGVLNLIINGLPSILPLGVLIVTLKNVS